MTQNSQVTQSTNVTPLKYIKQNTKSAEYDALSPTKIEILNQKRSQQNTRQMVDANDPLTNDDLSSLNMSGVKSDFSRQ